MNLTGHYWIGDVIMAGGLFNPFVARREYSSALLYDNRNRLARILYRLKPYSIIAWHAFRCGVPITDLVRAQFPFVLPFPVRPSLLCVELGTICNLRCLYCDVANIDRPREFMDAATFGKVLDSIVSMGISRVKVGGGEATLHPDFARLMKELAGVTKYLNIVSNGQWEDDGIIEAMLSAPVNLIEVSVDAGGMKVYETSREGASYSRLLRNLDRIMTMKRSMRSRTLVNIRLMLRPSQRDIEADEVAFYSRRVDTVMKQYLLTRPHVKYRDDLYDVCETVGDNPPKCELIFKSCEIKYNGDVPLCGILAKQSAPERVILGNINEKHFDELWNGDVAVRYRHAHRRGEWKDAPGCAGCKGICSR